MKIVNVSSLYPPNVVGGAEQGLKVMSEAMVELGHDVSVITLAPPGPAPDKVSRPVDVHAIELANLYWPYDKTRFSRPRWQKLLWHVRDASNGVMARRVASVVRELAPDVVLTRNLQGFSTAVIPAVRGLGVPHVHVLHDYSLVCPQTTLFRNGKACGLRSARCRECRVLSVPRARHARHVDNVMGVSQSVVDFHHDHGLFLGARTRVVHNALKPDLVPAAAPRTFPVSRPFVLGFIGRVEKFKGVETLLEAFRTLADHFPVQLRIAGRGDEAYVASLKEKYGDLPVTFVGFAKNTEFYQAIDALVYPSEWLEALGNSVFEAFSQGVPVVGSDVGGIPETIDHGTNGFIFKAGQPAALTEAMQGVVQDPNVYEQLSAAALGKSHEYAAPRRAQEYIDFLQDVVKGPP